MPAEPTYTYSTNPATDDKDAVRFLLRDTNPDALGWLVSDEEILFALQTEGGRYFAAAQCAEVIAARFSGPGRSVAEKRIGDLAISGAGGRMAKGAEDWIAVARMLRTRAGRAAMPLAGGVDRIDRESRTDTALLQPDFTRGMNDIPPGDAVLRDISTEGLSSP